MVNLNENEINESINSILLQWPNKVSINDSIVKKEALFWKQRWIGLNVGPRNFIDALNECDQIIFPNIYNRTRVIIPITIATPERSFSTSENRLNGLAHIEKVVGSFSKNNRRLAL